MAFAGCYTKSKKHPADGMSPPYTQPRSGNPALAATRTLPGSPAVTPRPAFYLTAVFVFLVCARFPEIMDIVTGSALRSVRIAMVLVVLALPFGADLRAAFSKVGVCLIGFTLWMCACVPFSIWRGGSARTLRDSWAISLFSFVVIAAGVQGLEQCRKIMYTMAAATVVIEIVTLVTGRLQGGRIALLGGTLGNANYLALILLMGLPFCLFVWRTKPGLSPLKFACLVMLLCTPVTISATGSRGGLVTLTLMFILYFWPLPSSQKVVVGILALILLVIAVAWSSRSALERFRTMFRATDGVELSGSEKSAMESADLRKDLLLASLRLTVRHPVLGVGPGMFSVANANYEEVTKGRSDYNAWHDTHNTFTQLSCEDGLPGLLLYCVAIGLCFKIARSAEKRARQDPAMASLGHMAFTLRLALIAFTGTAMFAGLAYAYYFPMLAGVCVAVDRATAPQKSDASPQAATTRVQFQPARNRPRA